MFYLLSQNGIIFKLTRPSEAMENSTNTINQLATQTEPVWTFSRWLNPATKIDPPIFNLAVEGSIFAINKDNIVFELANGSNRNQIKLFEPLSQVFTLPSHKNVYLLSPANGLIVVIGKNGDIKKRLGHSELAGAKSFLVNSQERVVYFLKGKKVYSFEI